MKKQEIADLACAELEKLYPGAQCTLDYGEPYQLMMATRTSLHSALTQGSTL